MFVRAMLVMLLAGAADGAAAEELRPTRAVRFQGELKQADQISGAAFLGELLILCPDEKARLNVLSPSDDGAYRVLATPKLLDDNDAEIDMEGVAVDGDNVYVIGSHSLARKRVTSDRSYAENRGRMLDVEERPYCKRLFRLHLDEQGKITSQRDISLSDLLDRDPLLKRFTKLPSKENGIDIEGIAAANGRLTVGFRGPVLRGNYASLMQFDFGRPEEYKLLFVPLGGRGIRDITAIKNGFLILAGPVGDGDGTYDFYYWDGTDCLPGNDAPSGKPLHLGTLPAREGKAEGVTVLEASGSEFRVLVVYDGVEDHGDVFVLPRSE